MLQSENVTECLSQSAENVEGSRLTSKMSCLTRKNQSIETDSKMIEWWNYHTRILKVIINIIKDLKENINIIKIEMKNIFKRTKYK